MDASATIAAFKKAKPYFTHIFDDAAILDDRPHPRLASEIQSLFPIFSQLLCRSRRIQLSNNGKLVDLLVWRSDHGFVGWVCGAPQSSRSVDIYPAHSVLLTGFGGVQERLNEWHSTWWLNHEDVLDIDLAGLDTTFLEQYSWAFENGEVPPFIKSYYAVAREVNGNITLCCRQSGRIVLFAPDHHYHHITPLPGFPEYTFYSINGAPDFGRWLENIAEQWLAVLR